MSVKLEYFPEMNANPKTPTKNTSKANSTAGVTKKRSASWITNCMELMQQLLRELINKYFLILSDEEKRRLLGQMRTMWESSNATKGHLELAAVVVFYQYSDIIRLSMKEYCARNQLNIKAFNKNYKLYYALFRKGIANGKCEEEETPINHLKTISQEEERESTTVCKRMDRNNISNPKEAIDQIYDCIFKSSYFQENRRETIERIAMRCEKIDQRIYDAMEWADDYATKTYYIIFSLIKQFGAPIQFKKYSSAVQQRTGLLIGREQSRMTNKLFKKCLENETNERNIVEYPNTNQAIDEEDQDLLDM